MEDQSLDRAKAASRANGAKSHGPISPEGKARSSQNARKHGLCADSLLLDGESREAFDSLRAEFRAHLKPVNAIAEALCETLVVARWRQTRIWQLEAELIAAESEMQDGTLDSLARNARAFRGLSDDSQSLFLIDRYETRYERQFARTLRLYRQINEPDPDFCQTNLVPNPDTPGPSDNPAPYEPLEQAPCEPHEPAPHGLSEAPPPPRSRQTAHAPGACSPIASRAADPALGATTAFLIKSCSRAPMKISVTVNGTAYTDSVEPRLPLIHYLALKRLLDGNPNPAKNPLREGLAGAESRLRLARPHASRAIAADVSRIL